MIHKPILQSSALTLLTSIRVLHVSDAFCSLQHQRVSPLILKTPPPPVWTSLQQFGDENEDSPSDISSSGFDGQGFAGYLAPYAIALIGSVLVTALAFKFFFLDY
mmetsp:Transcript_1796/g.2472  ORF Transcript_1796/g.2472 Transcript_1796/m.2472 type:complete len:105 (+) Transcript_1796:91-405(+)